MNEQVKELTISVPWGHIAAKAFGDDNDEYVLMFHGRQDNAGTFDRLIPLLPQHFYYISIDLPSHGKSSHIPAFFPIHIVDFVIVLKLMVEHFQKESYILLGHSLGGWLCHNFAILYPHYVKKLIMVEIITQIPVGVKRMKQNLLDTFNTAINVHEKAKKVRRPTYSYEEALAKIQRREMDRMLTVAEATPLLERAIESVGDGRYSFTLDQRMKKYAEPIHDFSFALKCLEHDPIHCPVLFVLGTNSPLTKPMTRAFDAINTWQQVDIKYVEGGHDVHITDPEKVAFYINVMSSSMEQKPREIKIPVPWGYVAAVTWGDRNNEPVLMFHGSMDNAGVFTRLIQLLPKNYYYIAVDLPGHGKSSHFPPYLPIHALDYVLVYKLLVIYFQKQSYTIIAHSLGGWVSTYFTILYPQYVNKLVLIDNISLTKVYNVKEQLTRKVEKTIDIYEKCKRRNRPSYTYEQALAKIQNREWGPSLTTEQAVPILERGIEKVGNGQYSFTADQRMRAFIDPMQDSETTMKTLNHYQITCPVLSIIATKSPLNAIHRIVLEGVKNWRQVNIKYVDGSHDIHITHYEIVASYIGDFLLKQRNKI